MLRTGGIRGLIWPWRYAALRRLNETIRIAQGQRIENLERAAAESERARLSLELSNAHLQNENTFLRDQMVKALENERFALRFQANCASQKEYGVKTYADTPGIPEFDESKLPQPEPARVQGLDLKKQAMNSFLAEARQRHRDKQMGDEELEALEQMAVSF